MLGCASYTLLTLTNLRYLIGPYHSIGKFNESQTRYIKTYTQLNRYTLPKRVIRVSTIR